MADDMLKLKIDTNLGVVGFCRKSIVLWFLVMANSHNVWAQYGLSKMATKSPLHPNWRF